MIDRCLSLIQMVEVYLNKQDTLRECRETFIVSMFSKMLSLLFIFIQTFFIFKYANIIINYGRNASIMGLMHILSTNFCVTIKTIVSETVSEIRNHNQDHQDFNMQSIFNIKLYLFNYKILTF
jgi:hypothetical protein